MGPRRAVAQSGRSFLEITANPLGGGFGSYMKAGSSTAQAYSPANDFNQSLSTAQRESGILMDVHSV
jgi:hypothetical protein